MANQKLKRLLALLLSLVMMGSIVTSSLSTAFAAEGSGGVSAADDPGTGGTGTGGGAADSPTKTLDYGDGGFGRPNLYIDFLGDNGKYKASGYDAAARPTGALETPGAYDQSKITNPSVPENQWERYKEGDDQPGTIFWVGVGVDRTQVFQLLRAAQAGGDTGLVSLELGFYYNANYIEPYVGTNQTFAETLAQANIDNGAYPQNTQWSDHYTILNAVCGIQDVQTEPITQEVLENPSIEDILADRPSSQSADGTADWQMMYVSLALKDLTDSVRRLRDTFDEDLFDASGNYIPDEAPQAASGKDGPQYLMLVPFRLNSYDGNRRLCLRLIRNATHFSIGGGDMGTDPYGAWERTTVRNPGRDLKLLTNFTGDLNIFADASQGEPSKIRDISWTAFFEVIRRNPQNKAQMGIIGDPSLTPVYVDDTSQQITDLQGGTGMEVLTQAFSGYKVTVTVYQGSDKTGPILVHQEVDPQKHYTFVMPESNVYVVVDFGIDNSDNNVIYLAEVFDEPRKEGNETVIKTPGYDDIMSRDPVVEGHEQMHSSLADGITHKDGPAGKGKVNETITVRVSTHADYLARVRVYNMETKTWIPDITATGTGSSITDGVATLPQGGSVTFTMPQGAMDVEVTYVEAPTSKAILEVYHDTLTQPPTKVSEDNTAQLAYLAYDEHNLPSTAYSGQVYHTERDQDKDGNPLTPVAQHRQVKDPSHVVGWVPASAATLSGSLGGDTGRTGRIWKSADLKLGGASIMTLLYQSASMPDFSAAVSGLDFSSLEVLSAAETGGAPMVGLRKNLAGEIYGDNEKDALAFVLWEMRERIRGNTGLSALYIKTVNQPDTTPPVQAFQYLDITPAQVQAYRMAVLEAEEEYRQYYEHYRDLYHDYQLALRTYQEVALNPVTATAVAPIAPLEPRTMSVETLAGGGSVRHKESDRYVSDYVNPYKKYIQDYQTYIDGLKTMTSGGLEFTKEPKPLPALADVKWYMHSEAVTKVKGHTWAANTGGMDYFDDCFIETRDSRTVWVALEASSAYEEVDVKVCGKQMVDGEEVSSGVPLPGVTVSRVAGYRNVYSFRMPEEDCVVQVTYRQRGKTNLEWEINGAGSKLDNLTVIEAFQSNDPQVDTSPAANPYPVTVPYPARVDNSGRQSISRLTGTIKDVLQESTVTVRVRCAEGYTATVTATDWQSNPITVVPPQVFATSPEEEDVYTLQIPAGSGVARLVVTYSPDEEPKNRAVIRLDYAPNTQGHTDNSVQWVEEGVGGVGTVRNDVPEGERLHGVITIAPGYYIHAVTATGASGSYTYTLSGNGYNNGYGTPTGVPLDLFANMPDEDLLVTVIVKRGLPPEAPATMLTLTVKDDDNNDKATRADNWARATVLGGAPGGGDLTLGAVGYVKSVDGFPNGSLTDADYVAAGQVVVVDYSCVVERRPSDNTVNQEKSYYVSSITVGPRDLGVQLTWLPNNQVRFVMPVASAGITVEFKKGIAPNYHLYTYRTEDGLPLDPGTAGNLNPNIIRSVGSGTIGAFLAGNAYEPTNLQNPEMVPSADRGTGAATAGEQVTVRFTAKPGYYVQDVELFSNTNTYKIDFTVESGPNDGSAATNFLARFTMPAGPASFVVHYRQGPPSEVPDYAVTLVMRDDDNLADAGTGAQVVDNWVRGTYESVTSGAVAPDPARTLGKLHPSLMDVFYPQQGDKVTVEYSLQPGFYVEYVAVNQSDSTARRIFPTYHDTVINPDESSSGKASFTMPGNNITVVARISKIEHERPQYTANLILRPPAGVDVDLVGQGSFIPDGSLDNYHNNAVFSKQALPGARIDVDLFAKDGYYIRKITIEPDVGAATLTGGYGYQSGSFVMPAANVNVNVFFEKGWPDEVKYDLTVQVIDPTYDPAKPDNNFAALRSAGGTALPPADRVAVHGGERHTALYAAGDRETVVVDIHRAAGFHVTPQTIQVTDSAGAPVDWWYTEGGIAFTMPPMSTTVTVTFLKTTPEQPEETHTAHLHFRGEGADSMTILAGGGTAVSGNDSMITGLHAGDGLTLEAQPGTGYYVAAAYTVDSATGRQLMLPVTLVTGGTDGTTHLPVGSFAMPNADAHVYVVYRQGTLDHDQDKVVNLIVSGERGPAGVADADANRATMTEKDSDPKKELTVAAVGADAFLTQQGKELTVTFDYDPQKYYIAELTVTDGLDEALAYHWISMLEDTNVDRTIEKPNGTWTVNGKKQIALTVPATGGTVHVRYGKVPTVPDPDDPDNPKPQTYKAQIVVNDEIYSSPNGTIPSRNDAAFIKQAGVAELIEKRLRYAKPGDPIDISLTVHEGYRIEYIKVVPQEHGIAPALMLTPEDSQDTSFLMPAGDVVIYVKFVRDRLSRYNATLMLTTDKDNPADATDTKNWAQITSGFTGTRGPIAIDETPVAVQAAAGREWVTVEYGWNHQTTRVASVTVKDHAGKDVPFTQVSAGKLILPMVARDVIITVTYEPYDPAKAEKPVLYPVILHVIDETTGHELKTVDQAYGRLIYTPVSTDPAEGEGADTDKIAPGLPRDGEMARIDVPAGKLVDLHAFSAADDPDGKIYIKSAYVLYEAGGQMIECNLTPDDPGPGFSGKKESQFAVHPGRNDVYVTVTRTHPDNTDYSAVLMLKGPAADMGSFATICVGEKYDTATRRDTAMVNRGHGVVTATRGETITVSVTPTPGYVIDYILMTPLGEPTVPVRVDNTCHFTMPRRNIAITVYLKESNQRLYNATLHFIQQGTTATTAGANRGDLFWTPDGATGPTAATKIQADLANPVVTMKDVAENAAVTLTTTLDAPYVVLSAYVLRGTVLVPLAPALEGTAENATQLDNTLADGEATFTMPGSDVDVYLVVTDDPPARPDWHTAVLLVTDKNGLRENVGQNSGDIYLQDAAGLIVEREQAETGLVDTTQTPPTVTSRMGHTFLTVWAGDQPRIQVNPARPGYTFSRPATISHSQRGVSAVMDSPTGLSELATSPYLCTYTVGNYNSAVHLHFAGSDANKNDLTVEINDPDNPSVLKGDPDYTENRVNAAPDGMTALELVSTTAAGAWQVVRDVEEGNTVQITATPHDDTATAGQDYLAYATYTDANTPAGDPPVRLPMTWDPAQGHYTTSITMPGVDAHVTVTFYRPHKATIRLVDRNLTDPTSRAQMTENFTVDDPRPVASVNQAQRSADLTDLPRGTVVTGNMTQLQPTGKLTAVLLTQGGSTTLLAPRNPGETDVTKQYYDHTMAWEDATMTFVVDGKDTQSFVAAVRTVNKPEGAADPTIASATPGADKGAIWTSANEGDTVTVTVPVPAGYRVDLTADSGVTLSQTALTADGSATFSMPGRNVQVTVTYVKTRFDLTLRIENEPLGDTAVGDGTFTLTTDGASRTVAEGTSLSATADPHTGSRLAAIFLQTASGAVTRWTPGAGPYAFNMPGEDATLTVIYRAEDDPVPGPDPEADYYIASVRVVGDDGVAANRVPALQNRTTAGLPSASPSWVAALAGDDIHLTFTSDPAYTVSVAATRSDGTTAVAVVQQGLSGVGTADLKMPADDVMITVTFSTVAPPREDIPTTLRLVGHKAVAGNQGEGTSDSGGLLDLKVNGASPAGGAISLEVPTDTKSPIRVTRSATSVGERLTISADWASGFQILRITVGVPDGAGGLVETEVPRNSYGSNATARLYVPARDAVVTVYYANIYTATLYVMGATAGDKTEMTDDRRPPVTSTGTAPVTQTGDQLLQLSGGEEIRTTAVPDPVPTAPKRRLVGVVYESASTGAHAVAPDTDGAADRYDFEMIEEDVDVYAVYEDEPEEEKDRSYIAKVTVDKESVGYGQMGNQTTIKNDSDAAALHGTHWTAAKAGETVTVTVELAPGYQAVVTSAKMDDEAKRPTPETDFDYYLSRTRFVVTGKTATFTMPAGTDATVTIKYVKGYALELQVTDSSQLASAANPNTAQAAVAGNPPALRGESGDASGTVTYSPHPARLDGVTAGATVSSTVAAATDDVEVRVARYTPFTGTVTLPNTAAAGWSYDDYPMPAEDTVESVLFRDKNREDKLLARVRLKGESDVNGNGFVDGARSVTIRDTDDPATVDTTEGVIWTTTKGSQTIEVKLTVAKGYVAKIMVLRDDSIDPTDPTDETKWKFLDAKEYNFKHNGDAVTETEGTDYYNVGYTAGTGGNADANANMSDPQTFTFTMPRNRAADLTADPVVTEDKETDVTVIIEYVYAGTIPAPYDPRNTKANNRIPTVADLDDGFLYGENRGDYALLEIPTLSDGEDAARKFYDTDQYDRGDAATAVTFHFYLWDEKTDVYTELVLGRDVTTEPADPEDVKDATHPNGTYTAGDPYNYENIYRDGAGQDYVGARLILRPVLKDGVPETAGGKRLMEMLQNRGSLYDPATKTDTRATKLYATAVNAIGEESTYTELWVRPAYTLALRVISYAPTHPMEGTLYRPLTQAELDEARTVAGKPTETFDAENPAHYAIYKTTLAPVAGEDKWQQVVRIRSSELLGNFMTEGQTPTATYTLVLDKVAHIRYTREEIELAAASPYYNNTDGVRTFSVQDVVTLVAGDVDGDQQTKWQDYELLRDYVERMREWSNGEEPGAAATPAELAEWAISTRNPETVAYRCDLNGDGVISIADLNILSTYANYNKTAASYNWTEAAGSVTPHGLIAPDYTGGVVLLWLPEVEDEADWWEGPAPLDPVGDRQLTPAELLEAPQAPAPEEPEGPASDRLEERPVEPEAPVPDRLDEQPVPTTEEETRPPEAALPLPALPEEPAAPTDRPPAKGKDEDEESAPTPMEE